MKEKANRQGIDFPIPARLNIGIALAAYSLAVLLLIAASRCETWYGTAGCAVLFSFVNMTNFSLLHESVHGTMHPNATVNRWFGRISAVFFPTTFTLQRRFHLGHHRRNRSEAELFDLYEPGDSIWLKRLVIYAMPSGMYWLCAASVNLLFLFCPFLLKMRAVRDSAVMDYSSFDAMLDGAQKTDAGKWTIRGEILLTIGAQLSLIYLFGVSWTAWLACYWVFGIQWGSLQYTDHVLSERQAEHGAWNLRVTPPVRWLFLNYHYHLCHHQNPQVPWLHLPKLVDPQQGTVSFWGNFILLLKGPYPADQLDELRARIDVKKDG